MQPKQKLYLSFFVITAIYILSRWVTFKGFNGADDLHYAMLASNMIKGDYTPFNANDIFSGRVLLIALQALVYYIGGINVFTTQATTIAATVLCAYLLIFKLAIYKTEANILLAAALFYFNPVITSATLGVMPDIFVLLASILVFIVWKKIDEENDKQKVIIDSFLCSLIIFAALFFKENAIILIPFLLIISLTGSKKNILAGLYVLGFFSVLVLALGVLYYHYTGDFFFRVHQIENSAYDNPCNYTTQPASALLARLTYGVWQHFIDESFYPVMLASLLLALNIFFNRSFKLKENRTALYFIVLVVLGLYLPFSFSNYQPLCIDARHFIFLIPYSILICVSFIEKSFEEKTQQYFFVIASIFLLSVCVLTTGEKWYWMIYGFLLGYFLLNLLILKIFPAIKFLFFAIILWLYMPYHIFFGNSNWFSDLQNVSGKASGNIFYFPEHDNMLNWQLIHGFNDSLYCYNLEKHPFMIFNQYYESIDNSDFKPGWLIVDAAYTVRSDIFLQKIKSILDDNHTMQICDGNVCAYFLDSVDKLSLIRMKVENDEEVIR